MLPRAENSTSLRGTPDSHTLSGLTQTQQTRITMGASISSQTKHKQATACVERQPQTGDRHWEPWGAATKEQPETNTTEHKPLHPYPMWNHLIHLLLPSPVNQRWGRGLGITMWMDTVVKTDLGSTRCVVYI